MCTPLTNWQPASKNGIIMPVADGKYLLSEQMVYCRDNDEELLTGVLRMTEYER